MGEYTGFIYLSMRHKQTRRLLKMEFKLSLTSRIRRHTNLIREVPTNKGLDLTCLSRRMIPLQFFCGLPIDNTQIQQLFTACIKNHLR